MSYNFIHSVKILWYYYFCDNTVFAVVYFFYFKHTLVTINSWRSIPYVVDHPVIFSEA